MPCYEKLETESEKDSQPCKEACKCHNIHRSSCSLQTVIKYVDSVCGLIKLLIIAHTHACVLIDIVTFVNKHFPSSYIFTAIDPTVVSQPSALLSVKQNNFFSYCVTVLLKKHGMAHLTRKFSTRCLICLATSSASPLNIHYSLKYRTTMLLYQHLDPFEILHKLPCFKSLTRRKGLFSLHICLCIVIYVFQITLVW